jgi:16S rRNA (guanine527-N7)-methyltransferase
MYFENRKALFIELGFNQQRLPQLKQYLELLWSSNEELNLISRKMTFEELVDNHVIDCLLPLKKFPLHIKVAADFGSGGGLPGVIYAIQFPSVEFQLYEKSKLKQEFLNRCRLLAPNLVVKGEIPSRLSEVDLIIARAFKTIDVILEVSRNYYLNGGRYFLLKARKEKIEEEILLARKKFKDLKFTIERLESPVLEVERHLVLI